MISRARLALPFAALMTAFALITARLFLVQIWHHEEIARRVDRMVRRERPAVTCRGSIVDRCGRNLALSVKSYTLFVDPTCIGDIRQANAALKQFSITIPADIAARHPGSSYVPLVDGLDTAAMQAIKDLEIRGIGFTDGYRRQYPEGRLASHVLGVVGQDGTGLEGVELAANGYLTGEKVRLLRYRDGRGREISDKLVDLDRYNGATVALTIDRNLQFIAEQEAETAWKESGSRRAMVLIQDPRSGEMLAIACRPDYDPADFKSAGIPLSNPALSDIFEPGSTFKIVTIAAALQEKLVNPRELIWCENGAFKVSGHTIGDHEKKGMISVTEVLAYSSNIGSAKIGMKLGKERLYHYIRQLGFNAKTEIDLPGEARGLLQPPAAWSGLSLPIISFGQEVGVTALQVINAFSAVANGGYLLEPSVISRVTDPRGTELYKSQRRVIRQALAPETAAAMRKMLTAVVEKGTGAMAAVPGYSVGGKTGTAQKRDPATKRYSTKNYVASFCGIFPAADPQLTIFVVLDEPKGDYYASSRAAPVFARVASRAALYLGIRPDRPDTVAAPGEKKRRT